MTPDLEAALARLRWVVPGRDYSDLMIDDVQTVLRHFGLENAHGGTPTPSWLEIQKSKPRS